MVREKLVTPREAAQILGVSYPTVKQWIYKRKLRTVKTAGGIIGSQSRSLTSICTSLLNEVMSVSEGWVFDALADGINLSAG